MIIRSSVRSSGARSCGMLRSMRAIPLLVLVGFSLGLPVPRALAQDSESADGQAAPQPELSATDEEARIHFNSGRAYFDRGAYESAAQEFETGYARAPLAAFSFNLYLTYERLGDFAKAAEHLERYLQEEPETDGRATLEERLVHLRERAAGEAADADQIATAEAAAAAAAAQAEEATARREEGASPQIDEASDGGRDLFTPAMISYGAGAVGLATFGIFAALAASEDGKLEEDCGTFYAGAGSCAEGDADSLRAFSLIADIGLGLGIAGAIAGTVLILLHDPGSGESRAGVAPMVGPGIAGVSAAGVF